MPLKVCNGPGCGRLSPTALCPECQAKANRRQYEKRQAKGQRTGTTAEYRKARAAAMRRAHYRCEHINPDGSRCGQLDRLEAHHINGDHHDHRLSNLAILCHGHHLVAERQRTRGTDA